MIGFSGTWQRPPTREELEGLIRDRVREEVYSREAIAMGLDRDDPIIRRRLQQKLQFVTDDVAALAEPTDAELADYLKTRAASFRMGRQHSSARFISIRAGEANIWRRMRTNCSFSCDRTALTLIFPR